MKNILFILFSFYWLVSYSQVPSDSIHIEKTYYDSGELKSEKYYRTVEETVYDIDEFGNEINNIISYKVLVDEKNYYKNGGQKQAPTDSIQIEKIYYESGELKSENSYTSRKETIYDIDQQGNEVTSIVTISTYLTEKTYYKNGQLHHDINYCIPPDDCNIYTDEDVILVGKEYLENGVLYNNYREIFIYKIDKNGNEITSRKRINSFSNNPEACKVFKQIDELPTDIQAFYKEVKSVELVSLKPSKEVFKIRRAKKRISYNYNSIIDTSGYFNKNKFKKKKKLANKDRVFLAPYGFEETTYRIQPKLMCDYVPRNGIVFNMNNGTQYFFEICFDCSQFTRSDSTIPKAKRYCPSQLRELQNLFKQEGLLNIYNPNNQ